MFKPLPQILEQASATTQQMLEKMPDWFVLQSISRQLEFMKNCLETGYVPSDTEKARINLGVLAFRNLEEAFPDYAGLLSDAEFAFKFHYSQSSLSFTPLEAIEALSTRNQQKSALAMALLSPWVQQAQLYGIFDAARNDQILPFVKSAPHLYCPLLSEAENRPLQNVAPYVIQFHSDQKLLQRILNEGLGDAWGIFIVSDHELDQVRQQLQRLLYVKVESQEKEIYFRFYDPRVFRNLAKILTPRQNDFIFGRCIQRIIYEDEGENLREFFPDGFYDLSLKDEYFEISLEQKEYLVKNASEK